MCSALVDEYLESQETHHKEARNVRSLSAEERRSVSGEFHTAVVVDAVRSISNPGDSTEIKSYRNISDDLFHNNAQQTGGEHRSVTGVFHAAAEVGASRSLCCPDNETAVKTYRTISHDQNDGGSVSGIVVQNVAALPPRTVRPPVVHDDHHSNAVYTVECISALDTDGLDPESGVSSPTPSTPAALPLSSSANDSGYVEQDGVTSTPRSTALASDCSASSPRRRAENLNPSSPVILRNYQKELAEPGCQGSNCIICAPTGSGKTFTAGFICKTRRDLSLAQDRRFKCLFVVCIRNLIAQQRDSLRRIMPESGIVSGIDDKLMLSEYFQTFDVVVATAQVCSCEEI